MQTPHPQSTYLCIPIVYYNIWIYSVSPPPQCFLLPQLQIICCYIARYCVKK